MILHKAIVHKKRINTKRITVLGCAFYVLEIYTSYDQAICIPRDSLAINIPLQFFCLIFFSCFMIHNLTLESLLLCVKGGYVRDKSPLGMLLSGRIL